MRPEEEQRLQHVKDCAERAYSVLQARDPISTDLQAELEDLVNHNLPISVATHAKQWSGTLESVGSKILIAASNLQHPQADDTELDAQDDDHVRLGMLLRVLGFFLVDAAHQFSSNNGGDHEVFIRIFKIALRTGRFCLDHDDTELAMKVLQRCSDYTGLVEHNAPIVEVANAWSNGQADHLLTLKHFVMEYYMLRMLHAIKTDRDEVALYFYTKVDQQKLAASAALTEKAAEILHILAKAYQDRNLPGETTTWCQNALEMLDRIKMKHRTQHGSDLALLITSTAVTAYLRNGSPQSFAEASRLVEHLTDPNDLCYRPGPDVLTVQILCASPHPDKAKVEDVVTRIVHHTPLTDTTFKTIMQVMRKLKHFNMLSVMALIHILIISRLLPDRHAITNKKVAQERLSEAIVAFVVAATYYPRDTKTAIAARIKNVLDEVHQEQSLGLTEKAATAAQMVLWKTTAELCERSRALTGGPSAETVEAWLELMQHPLLDRPEDVNKGVVGRKSVLNRFHHKNWTGALAAFYAMSESDRSTVQSRYLAFKLALIEGDQALAQESLHIIMKHAKRDSKYLEACALTAQVHDRPDLAIPALQTLVDQKPAGPHFPTLLRCTARLLARQLEAEDADKDTSATAEELVILFERAAKNTAALRTGTDEDWRDESQWWSKTAFNLAFEQCKDMIPELLVRLLATCVHFLDCLPPNHQIGARHRRLACHFLSVSAFITIARANEEGSSLRRHAYMQVHSQTSVFKGTYVDWQDTMGVRTPKADREEAGRLMARRAFEVLRFDLECILHLKLWSELDAAVSALLNHTGSARWEILVDLMFILHKHAGTTAEVNESSRGRVRDLLTKSVNETWKQSKDIKQMAYWLRRSFKLHLEDDNVDFALSIVQQAASVASKGYNGTTDPYPIDELNWLASSAFNKSIEFLGHSEVEQWEAWTEGALELARYGDDNGSLHANMTAKKQGAEDHLFQGRTNKRRRIE